MRDARPGLQAQPSRASARISAYATGDSNGGGIVNAGRKWPAEWREYADPVSGARVRQLTDHRGHSCHLYFTNPGWHDGGRRLLFGSDRHNRCNARRQPRGAHTSSAATSRPLRARRAA